MKLNLKKFKQAILATAHAMFDGKHDLSPRQANRIERKVNDLADALEKTTSEARAKAARLNLSPKRTAVMVARAKASAAKKAVTKKSA